MTKRLFLAINLPLEIKKELADLALKLRQTNPNKQIKWVEDENFHLTLHFLGDTPEEKIPDIKQVLESIITDYKILTFQLSDKIDAFPNFVDPKVIFLDMKELNDGQTIKLQKQIGQALAKLDFIVDSRLFRLHLTLGRVKFKTSLQIPKFKIPNTQFHVSSIELMSSELTPTGPIYAIIHKFFLKPL